MLFFFKQKTAYEMRISDWSSGVCSSDLPEVAEQEVDVEAALVGLVDDDDLVGPQHAVALHLGEEDAVGHHLDECVGPDAVVEANRVAHGLADLPAALLADPLRHPPCRAAARRGVACPPPTAEATPP